MKKNIFFISLFLFCNTAFSQDFEEMCDSIQRFERSAQFDDMICDVFMITGRILSNSYRENESDESYAMQSIEEWMDGTVNYHLIIGGKVLEDCDKWDDTMKTIFKVSMTEFLFANHEYVRPAEENGMRYINIYAVREIIYGGAEIFMDYLMKQDRKVINKKLQKGLKLYKEGKLKEYMDN